MLMEEEEGGTLVPGLEQECWLEDCWGMEWEEDLVMALDLVGLVGEEGSDIMEAGVEDIITMKQ